MFRHLIKTTRLAALALALSVIAPGAASAATLTGDTVLLTLQPTDADLGPFSVGAGIDFTLAAFIAGGIG